MNSRQRRKIEHAFRKADKKVICPECGKPGRHYISLGEDSMVWMNGFWTCDKFYDPITKRRFDTSEPFTLTNIVFSSLFIKPIRGI